MEEKSKKSYFINIEEFQKRVIDCITSDEIEKLFQGTNFYDKPECKQAMIHGMCIACMMTSYCTRYIKDNNE